ncbi:hypothetical protein TrCOL_g12189 [Triparma columacea]|uniref:Uncharacterized protein n=1 Tax=Triparma columacea TaxID=722753 RepID=A0A9W7GC35_9STRA|nr:hypothetical protein TrCOL_g12189 [Triparma columacea]
METETAVWYGLLCVFAAFNVVLTIREYKKQKWSTSDVLDYGYQSKMFYLCIPFVFECAYRSVLPRIDIPRMCFFDVWPNMVLFGRLSAFVGEWCWMLQISLALQKILGELDIVTEKKGCCTSLVAARRVASLLPFICLLAECFGTAGPVTTNNLWCIFEACTWTTMFTITTLCALIVRRSLKEIGGSNKAVSRFNNVLILTGFVYVPYMLISNIPLYVQRYHEDQDNGVEYISFSEGLPDIAYCHDASTKWEDWKEDAGWMVGYFGPAVWTSVWLMNAPSILRDEVKRSDDDNEVTGNSFAVTLL